METEYPRALNLAIYAGGRLTTVSQQSHLSCSVLSSPGQDVLVEGDSRALCHPVSSRTNCKVTRSSVSHLSFLTVHILNSDLKLFLVMKLKVVFF